MRLGEANEALALGLAEIRALMLRSDEIASCCCRVEYC